MHTSTNAAAISLYTAAADAAARVNDWPTAWRLKGIAHGLADSSPLVCRIATRLAHAVGAAEDYSDGYIAGLLARDA